MIIALAIRTGIPPQAWLDLGDDAIDTALDLLNEQDAD